MVRLSPAELRAVDEWLAAVGKDVKRPEAIRILMMRAIKAGP